MDTLLNLLEILQNYKSDTLQITDSNCLSLKLFSQVKQNISNNKPGHSLDEVIQKLTIAIECLKKIESQNINIKSIHDTLSKCLRNTEDVHNTTHKLLPFSEFFALWIELFTEYEIEFFTQQIDDIYGDNDEIFFQIDIGLAKS